MSKCENLTGMTFGQLTVIERAENDKYGSARWLCKCSCGNECVVAAGNLKKGQTTCGCGQGGITHGMTNTKIYNKWRGMMQRCYYPKHKRHKDYGGRGIRVCERWHKFENFYEDVSKLENFGRAGYTLDRIRVNEDYEPGNVRWADAETQSRNKRNNVIVEYEGVEMSLAEAAEKSGINYNTLLRRYHAGDRGEKLFRPVKKTN